MFFVADYDAVCAIMTTSLFLSPASSLSIYLAIIPLPHPIPTYQPLFSRHPLRRVPRRFPLGGCGFFPSLCLFFRLAPLSSPCRRGQTLLLPQPLATTSSRTRQEATKLVLFLAMGFSRYTRIPVGFSDSPSLTFCFISLALFRFLYVRLPLSDSSRIVASIAADTFFSGWSRNERGREKEKKSRMDYLRRVSDNLAKWKQMEAAIR